MTVEFEGSLWYWRGPAPFYFVTAPERESAELKAIQRSATYGWGMIPVTARIGDIEWTTALFPKDGRFVVPIKTAVRKPLKLDEGDDVTIRLEVTFPKANP